MGILIELTVQTIGESIIGKSFAALMIFIFALAALFAIAAWWAFAN